MIRKTLLAVMAISATITTRAENWDYVISSGEYYYGTGTAATEAEANDAAMADLASRIATHVSNDFTQIDDLTTTNGNTDHKSRVLMCVKTYSQATLTNVQRMEPVRKGDLVTARIFMKCSELARIFEGRIAKAKDMATIADECLEKAKIDMALQYYYWAYSLARSVQHPNEVSDTHGILVDWIPVKINEILDDISVRFDRRDGDYVDLLFDYKGQPVSSIEFTYSDGRADCQGSAKDGRGMIEMIAGYTTDVYHISIDYEYKGQARGDNEMESVLNVVTKRPFGKAEKTVKSSRTAALPQKEREDKSGIDLKPQESQIATDAVQQTDVIDKVIRAIAGRNYSDADGYFTIEGLDVYRKLIKYGTARIVGTPRMTFFKGTNNTTVVRGLQMSFTFNNGGRKKTFVEDVVFTLNTDGKIVNVALGLGQVAENDILCREAPGWKDDTRELLMEFMENYKTAYCLKRLDYIRDIFDDEAKIIVGNVVRKRTRPVTEERQVSIEGQETITYNRYTKDQYLNNLKRCFARNEFINLRFSNNEVQWLEKFEKEELFAIQIRQEYTSSTYSDIGYLFLLIDMTNHDEPLIKVRTWQPNEVPLKDRFNAGDFFND